MHNNLPKYKAQSPYRFINEFYQKFKKDYIIFLHKMEAEETLLIYSMKPTLSLYPNKAKCYKKGTLQTNISHGYRRKNPPKILAN